MDLDISNTDDVEEESIGGYVFVNVDDDNDNGTPDKDESGTVSGEDDLVELQLQVAPSNLPSGTLTLAALAGGANVKVWESSTKGTEIPLPKTWTIGTDIVPSTLYLEGITASDSQRDLELQLKYTNQHFSSEDVVKATVVEVEVEEVVAFDNRIPANRAVSTPGTNIPRLLFYYDCSATGIKGAPSIQATVNPSTVDIQYDFDKLKPSLSKTFTNHFGDFGASPVVNTFDFADDSEGDTTPDMILKYGLNSNGDSELLGDEIKGNIHLHLITKDNYDDSVFEIKFTVLPFILNDGADALFRRFVTGSFTGADTDFIPTSSTPVQVRGNENPNTALSRHQFTHNFGATFVGVGASAVATVPVFEYGATSPGADNASNNSGYRAGVISALNAISAIDIQNSFGTGAVGTTVTGVVFNNLQTNMDLGILEVGVGNVTGFGSLTFDIKRTGIKTYNVNNIRAQFTVEDLFDFNFFGGGVPFWTGQRQNGASVQTGFSMCGNPSGAGEVFITRIVTNRLFDSGNPLSQIYTISIEKVVP